jgi:hypothetical protein
MASVRKRSCLDTELRIYVSRWPSSSIVSMNTLPSFSQVHFFVLDLTARPSTGASLTGRYSPYVPLATCRRGYGRVFGHGHILCRCRHFQQKSCSSRSWQVGLTTPERFVLTWVRSLGGPGTILHDARHRWRLFQNPQGNVPTVDLRGSV